MPKFCVQNALCFFLFAAAPMLPVHAQLCTLAGPLPRIVTAERGPYLVVADLEIPAGKMVTIEPGCVFLFKNFTGMHVQGRLVAEGNAMRPIVFTSEFDRNYNPSSIMVPNPYDWNGLWIHENAVGTSMEATRVLFSVYGIISDTKFIRITNGTFQNNGKGNLTIMSEEHPVNDEPYTYALSLGDAKAQGVPIDIFRDPQATRRNITRFGGLGIFLAGIGAGTYFVTAWNSSRQEFASVSSTDTLNLISHLTSDWEEAQKKRNFNRAMTLCGYSVGLLGAIGFGFSFTF